MEKEFRPAPIGLLARWMFRGLQNPELLGLPEAAVAWPDARLQSHKLGQTLGAPIGVAAGPHTQLTQNIVVAWLCGARFIELKTVQVLDQIKVSRPCIDANDETYNCEWSQELSLEQSYDEYLKAWVLLHALAHKMGRPSPEVFFSMSVGYDLKGIQSPTVQKFLRRMRDASEEMPAVIEQVAKVYPEVKNLPIPTALSNQVTLSTMHGCPPAEIEKIARYLLLEAGLNTWVKLNPTLLGPELLRSILNKHMGFEITVPDSAFEHDPRFPDAMQMVRALYQASQGQPASFGIKLSNTLEVINHRPIFPPNEKAMYMSGRALHPLTLTLAHKVTEELDGAVPLSFCGGADALNIAQLVADGLAPVTTCTDLLKPGGYGRLAEYNANLAAAFDRLQAASIDEFIVKSASGSGLTEPKAAARWNLARHAERILDEKRLRARPMPLNPKGPRKLDFFDCIAAPCQEACPTHQNIPDYLHLVAAGQPNKAMDVILRTNAMPGVTGRVCDHPCMEKCVRNHYDAPLAIREIKRFAVEHVTHKPELKAAPERDVRVAIIGAGPAGLSAAFYLRKAGFQVTVFEAKEQAGGMVSGVIPTYRLPMQPILEDVERVRDLGAELRFGMRLGDNLKLEDLKAQGFEHLVLTVGAQAGRKLEIPGEESEGVFDALDFLDLVRKEKSPALGTQVLVIGAGNSAMDAARTARRLVPVDGKVSIIYRRTRAQMPADHEEIEAAIDEGIEIRDLLAPAEVRSENGKVTHLVCTRMQLGEKDASGRPRPVPVPGSEMAIACDQIIVAISQEPVLQFLDGTSIKRRRDGTLQVDDASGETSQMNVYAGGDVTRGPATIIKAVADGRRIAESIAERHGAQLFPEPELNKTVTRDQLLRKKTKLIPGIATPTLELDRRHSFEEVVHSMTVQAAQDEASRCLDCDELCSLCVTVCPNRANLAYEIRPMHVEVPQFVVQNGQLVVDGTESFDVAQQVQILNVADFCNECGNCTTFCPTAGAPFRDKPRFHLDREGFEEAPYDAFMMAQDGESTVIEAKLGGERHRIEQTKDQIVYANAQVTVVWERDSYQFVEAEPKKPLEDGLRLDLTPCATMLTLLQATVALPGA